MRRHELAGLVAKTAPRQLERAVRPEAVDLGVAVTVGDEDPAVGGDGDVSRMVERRLPARRMPLAQSEQLLAFGTERDDLVRVAIGDEDPVRVVT
jgi:hypothetical protein